MYARKLNLKYSSRLLTDPESNIRMGTAYLADKIKEFGDMHLVLASYNAGERAVHRWQNERPGMVTDEFIDDIPYPETQNYVKKILGTAEDYRRLYGELGIHPLAGAPGSSTASSYVPAASKSSTTATHTTKKSTAKKSTAKKHKHH
jgi:soluble lytic murein transglycosylase